MVVTRSKKRKCLRPQPEKHSENSSNYSIDVIGLDGLSKCFVFLSLSDVHSASLACTEWKNAIRQSAPLWEGLLVQKYPSHADLPEGWCTSGRDEYLRRTSLMKCQFAPVRNLGGLPIPLQRRTPGSVLMKRWKPDAVVFMVDLFTGRNHFDDDIPVCREQCLKLPKLGPQIHIDSSSFRVPFTENHSGVDDDNSSPGVTLDAKSIRGYFWTEISYESEEDNDMLEAMEYFYDATMGKDSLHDARGLYVQLSYYVEGCNVPKCEPIILLSEHHTFFVDAGGQTTFRSDVEPAWLPGRRDWGNSQSPWEKEDAIQRSRVLSRQISKYGNVPLPFDPQVELWLSPPGEMSTHEENPIENDSGEECSVLMEVGFSIGEDYDCHFANLVVPPLLSLWNDAARQKERW